ncbi:MAG: copper amine oxidase N-terminal domain-containing protein [Lachnospiraceae bacterium]|nr:copper amine oxidase N-terminal domain-containing protein [Lachnospiraceae bacterium]
MKKFVSIILSITIMLSMVMVVSADVSEYTGSQYTVYIDGAFVDVNNLTIDGIEHLPIKELCGILGYKVTETSDNTYEITEGENCKNSEGALGKAVFTVGEDFLTTYSKDGQYENKVEMFPASPITVKVGDEIYISSYYFGRMFDLKVRFTEDSKITILTVNYRNEQIEYAPEYLGHIFVYSFPNEEMEIRLDRETMSFNDKPFIDADGRTQIPVRDFCEQLGCSVTWIPENQKVLVSTVTEEENKVNGGAGGDSFSFIIGERQYTINGTKYDMDTAAQIINNRTYVPLRYLAEAMNYYVAYNPGSASRLDMGYGYSVLNSYLGLGKELVFDEMDIDESYLLKSGDEAYPIPQHQEGNLYIVKNGYKKGHVVLEFYNDVLCAFQYVFKTEGEAFDEALTIYDYFVKLHGEAATYPGTTKTIAGIQLDESQFNDEVCSYYDEWQIDAPNELIETLLGDSDNALMKVLKMDINPRLSTVRVNYSKDVNFHNRSVLKIMDKDNNYIITDEDIESCEVRWMPRPEDGPSAGVVTGIALELKLTEKARANFKEATKRISEDPNGECYVKVLVEGIEIARPTVAGEIDSDEILVSGSNGEYETFKGYADKINAAIK